MNMLDQRNLGLDGAAGAVSSIEIARAAWLSPTTLLLGGALAGPDGAELSAWVSAGSEPVEATSNAVVLGEGALMLVALPQLERVLKEEMVLELRHGDAETLLDGDELTELLTDLQSLARQSLAHLDGEDRQRAVEFLARGTASVPRRDRFAACQRVFAMREALRERLPASVISENHPLGINLDRVLVVNDRSFYLEGWLHDEDSTVTRVTAVSPEGARAEILERLYRYARPDVESFFAAQGTSARTKHGFRCFIELDGPSLLSEGWLLEMESSDGAAVEITGPPVTRDLMTVRDAILWDERPDRLPDDELMSEHVYPAISRIQKRMGTGTIDRAVQFGTPPAAPDVSIVVPVYKRLDHLEMQLSEFVQDPEMLEADLVYVLDSPEQSDEFLEKAAQLTPLYNVPFRVVLLEQNVGFAGANNAGASLARGRVLLLLNSDILPDKPGWLSVMRDFYDSVPHIGALGPKLLYEDDSIQHAGMYFFQPPGSSAWVDAHYFKGMHRSLPAANVARPVPLVSGACLMIDRSLYDELGGLPGIYVRGDYEDSDLCLQLSRSGRENWYLPDVELYHLEGQSFAADPEPDTDRYVTNRYNSWVHTHIWRDCIEDIMQRRDGP
jgi:GT2 family glycosyltransferase